MLSIPKRLIAIMQVELNVNNKITSVKTPRAIELILVFFLSEFNHFVKKNGVS